MESKATDLEAAINIKKNITFKVGTLTISRSCTSGTTEFTVSAANTMSGYTILGIVGHQYDFNQIVLYMLRTSGTNVSIGAQNNGSTRTVSFIIYLLGYKAA